MTQNSYKSLINQQRDQVKFKLQTKKKNYEKKQKQLNMDVNNEDNRDGNDVDDENDDDYDGVDDELQKMLKEEQIGGVWLYI